MALTHRLVAALALTSMVGVAMAQFDGPAPVAWRWAQSATVPPTGSPLVEGDRVYVAVGNRMYALGAADGNQIWRFPVGEPLDSNFRTGVTAAGDLLVAATDGPLIVAVNKQTGQRAWTYNPPALLNGTPVAVGNSIVFGMVGDLIMALDARNGQPLWEAPMKAPAGLYSSMAAVGENLIYFTNDDRMRALNVLTKREAWSTRFRRLSSSVGAAVLGDTIYVNSGTYLTAIRANTGSGRWEQNVNQNLAFAPAASAEGVVAVSREGRLFTFDPNGRPIFRAGLDLQSAPVASPAFVGSMVAVCTVNGAMNLINPLTGDVLFNYIVPPLFRGARAAGASASAGTGGSMSGGGDVGTAGSGGGGAMGGGGGTPAGQGGEIKFVPAAGAPVVAGTTLLILNRDGSLIAFDQRNGVDLTAPVVEMLWPNAGDDVSPQLPMEIIFGIQDEGSGVKPDSIKVSVDGKEYEGVWNRDGFLSIKMGGNNAPLQDGRRVFIIEATDWMGNATVTSISVIVDSTISQALGSPGRRPGVSGTGASGGGDGSSVTPP